MAELEYRCCICDKKEKGNGNNPFPLVDLESKDSCCDICNQQIVVPMRFVVKECSTPQEARQKVKDIMREHNKHLLKGILSEMRNKRRRLN